MTEVSNLGNPGAASVTPAAATPTTPIAAHEGGTLGGDNLDMDAMKDFSRAQTEQKLKANPNLFGPVKKGKTTNEKESEETEEVEETHEEVASDDDEATSTETDAPPPDDDDADSEEDADELPDEVAEGEEVDGRKYIVAKAGDKALRIPKGATLEIKINGKTEPITVQEALNRASGGIHIERETTRLGRESKDLTNRQQQFAAKARIVNENSQILAELCEKSSPEDVAAFYAHLLGRDPNEVYNGIIRNAITEARKYEGLTEAQITLMNENRKLRLERMVAERRAHGQKQVQTQEAERAAIVGEMKRRGVSSDDWDTYANEASARLKSGEIDLEIKSAHDVLDYIVERKHEVKVDSAISSIDKNLLKDSQFKERVSEAVSKTEALHKRVMPPKEVQALVKHAVEIRNNAVRDTLSKKADRVVKSGRPTSQSGKSPKQENKKREPVLLRDHYDRLYGGN